LGVKHHGRLTARICVGLLVVVLPVLGALYPESLGAPPQASAVGPFLDPWSRGLCYLAIFGLLYQWHFTRREDRTRRLFVLYTMAISTALILMAWRVDFVIHCLMVPETRPDAINPLISIAVIMAYFGYWLGTVRVHHLSRASRLRATQAARSVRDSLAMAEVPLSDEECDLVLSRFESMGLLTLGMTDGELTVQTTPIGSLFRDIFS
jgi:hypothetical protein